MSIDANVTLILTRFPLILSCVKTGKEPRDACWEEPRESPGGFGKAIDRLRTAFKSGHRRYALQDREHLPRPRPPVVMGGSGETSRF